MTHVRSGVIAGIACAVVVLATRAAAGQPHLGAATRSPVPGVAIRNEPHHQPRPRLGLALGGGSARGLAHIGVLRWLEEHRVPVDLVAGTSIGGLVGGGYAMGMSPAELAALMRDTDWDRMFQSDSPFADKTFRRKQDKRAYPAPFEFGLRSGLTLPQSLNPGQQVVLLLDRISLPYSDLAGFDELPTPYRCVSADLRSRQTVVLDRGPLARAMRATMAIPGVFAPVAVGDQLLVDGGVLNNVPGDVVREMGADVVIAVDVSSASAKTEVLTTGSSMLSLLGRTLDVMMAAGARKGLDAADIVLAPDISGLDSMSWRQSDELAARGYQAAARLADRLLPYAIGRAEYDAYLEVRSAKRRGATLAPAAVRVVGVPPLDQQSIAAGLAHHVGGPVDVTRLERDIAALGGSDRYAYLSYRLTTETGRPELELTVQPKSYGPPFLAIGLELGTLDADSVAGNMSARLTDYDTFGAGSEVRVDFVLGTRQSLAAEMFTRAGRSPFFVSPRLSLERAGRTDYTGSEVSATSTVVRAGAGVDIGLLSARRAELRAGVDVGERRSHVRVGNAGTAEMKGAECFASLRFTFDGQDSPMIPSKGLFLRTQIRRYFGATDLRQPDSGAAVLPGPQRFWRGEVSASKVRRVRDRDRVFLVASGGTLFGARPIFDDFALGGPLKLGAYDNDSLRGPNYLVASGGYLKRVGRLPSMVGGNAYVGAWLETGSVFSGWTDARWRHAASVGLVTESILGPIFAGASLALDGHRRFYVAIAPFFR